MYSPINQDFVHQQMQDRLAEANAQHLKRSFHPNRRWWRKAARVAR